MANPGPASQVTPNTSDIIGNLLFIEALSVTLSPASVANATSAEQTFSGLNTGLLGGDVIIGVSKPTAQAGIGIVGWRVDSSVNDKFYLTFMNATAATVTPTASEVYTIYVARQETSAKGITSIV